MVKTISPREAELVQAVYEKLSEYVEKHSDNKQSDMVQVMLFCRKMVEEMESGV